MINLPELRTAEDKQHFMKAWESHRVQFAALLCQVKLDSPLFSEMSAWYADGERIIKEIADQVYPETVV